MTDPLTVSGEILVDAGFAVARTTPQGDVLAFEDATVIGFVFVYETPGALLASWAEDLRGTISAQQFKLRTAGAKAWNVYVALLAAAQAEYAESMALMAIEEDLSGTRKIARAGVVDPVEVRTAMLPLLALQSAPRLEAIDITGEIRQRATELPQKAIDAFLSQLEPAQVLQILEEPS